MTALSLYGIIMPNIWAKKGAGTTDTNRVKRATEWFYNNVFRDEVIQPRHQEPEEIVPSPIRAARSLERGVPAYRQSREAIFIKQAKLLVHYEDDYVYERPVLRYYPTYQSLTDRELRGYFSWRSKLRGGDIRKTSLSYAFLYIYELLNQIGVADPLDGYQKLVNFQQAYGGLDMNILPYTRKWLTDYVIYYNLDPALLADTDQVRFDKSLAVLANIENHGTAQIMEAATALSGRYLERSKFYREYREDMDTVTARVLRRISDHYAGHCKRTMVEQYFGPYMEYQAVLFESAVFYDRAKASPRVFAVDEVCTYRCRDGFWSVQKYGCPPRPSSKLSSLLKTIDSVMRECYAYRYPVKCEMDTKWILKLIREETLSLLAEKEAAQARKITIDYSRLAKIRRDAAATRDKLTVEEEAMEAEPPEALGPQFPAPESSAPETPLSQDEYRLLHGLLYGEGQDWVQDSGLMLSVLADSINEKLFDRFSDSVLVLEDQLDLVEDYVEDLKEMVRR